MTSPRRRVPEIGFGPGIAPIIMREGSTETPEPYDIPVDPVQPIASGDPPEPRINGPTIVGSASGRPFHHLAPATGQLTIVGGYDKLALTPPMGWNSWNV